MDFVIEMSLSREYNVILIIIDWLSKKRYYISYIVAKENTTLKEIARMLYKNV
jgi:hypothetical protein